jgi:hypothetical protein
MSSPLKMTCPEEACRNPEIRLTSVVFPAPFGPISPTISPGNNCRLTLSTARMPPK